MFKDRLRQARKARGLTLEGLAGRMVPPVTRGTVSHWESGRTKPKRDNMIQLARVLGVTAEWLFGDAEAGAGGINVEPVLRRDLLARVEIALESYLQAHVLAMAPADRWEAVESIYQWAEDAEREHGGPVPIKIESVRAFLRRVRPLVGL